MKNIVKIMVLGALMACLVPVVNAQRYAETPSATMDPAIQSQQIMQTSTRYQGTVYEPFSTATPSEQSMVGSYSPGGKGGPRRAAMDDDPWGGNQDAGHTEDESSPIGEPWVLGVFAVVMAGVIFLRRRKALKN